MISMRLKSDVSKNCGYFVNKDIMAKKPLWIQTADID